MPRAGERPRPSPTPITELSSLRHEWIPRVARRHEVLLDRPRAGPADQVEQAAGLVVRATGPPAPERLLPDHRARGLVVPIEVPRGVAPRRIRLRHGRG